MENQGECCHHGVDEPSEWVVKAAQLIPSGASALDLACGGLRHARFLASRGCTVVAVDCRPRPAAAAFGPWTERIEYRQTDLEDGSWPLGEEAFDAIVVTNYLHRPLYPYIAAALRPGGLLAYETFAVGNEAYGRPMRPEFLLRPGELAKAFAVTLDVLAHEQVHVQVPRPAVVQRLLARRVAFNAPMGGHGREHVRC
ncbi:MAG: class I SAM-dependent methyltransferase [Betaproteobacteria bacterium]|nr:class I SAM-dependent methyltransferase [Betaproteobacteria bacterium]